MSQESDDKDCLYEEGFLKSITDNSEHLNYNCFRYLMERQGIELNSDNLVNDVAFAWQSPKCGCVKISVEILDEANQIYTEDDDPFAALSLVFCVKKPENVEELLPNPEAVVREDQVLVKQEPLPAGKKLRRGKTTKQLKKRIRKMDKKHTKRRGKKFCCIKGIKAQLTDGDCKTPEQSVLDKAEHNFKLGSEICSAVFSACCKDQIIGKET